MARVNVGVYSRLPSVSCRGKEVAVRGSKEKSVKYRRHLSYRKLLRERVAANLPVTWHVKPTVESAWNHTPTWAFAATPLILKLQTLKHLSAKP